MISEELVDQIFEIIKDYHSDSCFEMTSERIIEWVNQFDEHDKNFVLSEFLHLLNNGIYISKENGKEILWRNLEAIASKEKYSDLRTFLWETRFILSQKNG
jgi:membrane-bound lytic murein transglycosylase MltF